MINPYRVIRELERKLEFVELARVKAEDENRVLYAKLECAREAESQARKDCLELIANIHQRPAPAPMVAPPPSRRPQLHGASLEAAMLDKFEKELGIDQPN